MPLNNFGFVYNGIDSNIYRSAQPDALGFKYLEAIGVTKIFKLNNDKEFPLMEEQKLFPNGQIYQMELPELYRANSMDDVIRIAQTINGMFLMRSNILIHCSHGRDRTGLVVGAWELMFGGKSIKEVNEERPSWGCNCIIEMIDSPDRHILSEIYILKCAGRL